MCFNKVIMKKETITAPVRPNVLFTKEICMDQIRSAYEEQFFIDDEIRSGSRRWTPEEKTMAEKRAQRWEKKLSLLCSQDDYDRIISDIKKKVQEYFEN